MRARTSRRTSRRLIVAIAIAAQVAAFTLTASPRAFASPCPMHLGLVQQTDQAAPHRGHEAPPPADETPAPLHPAAFGFACCATHMIGILSPPMLTTPSVTLGPPVPILVQAPTPEFSPGIDPPPRILL